MAFNNRTLFALLSSALVILVLGVTGTNGDRREVTNQAFWDIVNHRPSDKGESFDGNRGQFNGPPDEDNDEPKEPDNTPCSVYEDCPRGMYCKKDRWANNNGFSSGICVEKSRKWSNRRRHHGRRHHGRRHYGQRYNSRRGHNYRHQQTRYQEQAHNYNNN